MNNKSPNFILWAGIILMVVVVIFAVSERQPDDGRYDGFASCLSEKGAIFYGAFWCPHCQSQKKLFGSSASKLNYIECSTPDGRAQTPVCIDRSVKSYPTWEFADGSRELGEVSLAKLAEKTGCVLPQ
jgi:thiol-disulfide isomerase/thioredoxin